MLTKGLAESRRAKLMTAARDDGPFDPQTGLPASGYHAAFSSPYTVAAALLGGSLGASHGDFTDAVARDSRRVALAPWCFASRTSAAARRSGTPSLPSCA
ncbi:hypothetical protein [Streptomyces sp. NPDC001401]|uniref:hypothetical protein n=1 Tax=Streptomyces sp. NPDC001401 TaxID=3364570 RepID=UPI0036BFC758